MVTFPHVETTGNEAYDTNKQQGIYKKTIFNESVLRVAKPYFLTALISTCEYVLQLKIV
jgi:hypothetical protein